MLHGVDDVLFYERTGDAQVFGDLRVVAGPRSCAAGNSSRHSRGGFRQGALEHVQALAVIEDLAARVKGMK